MAEGGLRLIFIESLCVPTLEGFGVHDACLIDLVEGVKNEFCVGQLLASFGMHQKEHLQFLEGLEHDLDRLVAIHGIV